MMKNVWHSSLNETAIICRKSLTVGQDNSLVSLSVIGTELRSRTLDLRTFV